MDDEIRRTNEEIVHALHQVEGDEKSLRSVAAWDQRANVPPLEKADLAIRDKEYGATPLGWARYAGRQEAVEFLRSLGARTE